MRLLDLYGPSATEMAVLHSTEIATWAPLTRSQHAQLLSCVRMQTYYGQELVARPRRLALMNLYLHQVEPHIVLGDSIYDTPSSRRYNVVLTNPPSGTRGANQAPAHDDFVVATSNKQLNLIQHVITILKRGGRAAIVVPDNVLFANQAADVFKILMEDCDVHTVLRCPRGSFSPYRRYEDERHLLHKGTSHGDRMDL